MTTVRVTNPSASSITVSQGTKPTASLVIKRGTASSIQALGDVVSTGLEDGHTLVYDAETDKWVTQKIDTQSISSLDGGTY